jgi:hypothetical protein
LSSRSSDGSDVAGQDACALKAAPYSIAEIEMPATSNLRPKLSCETGGELSGDLVVVCADMRPDISIDL